MSESELRIAADCLEVNGFPEVAALLRDGLAPHAKHCTRAFVSAAMKDGVRLDDQEREWTRMALRQSFLNTAIHAISANQYGHVTNTDT